MTAKDIQGLLSGDEARVLFAAGDKKTYVFAVTRNAVHAKVIPLGAAALSEKVAGFRRGLDVEALPAVGGERPAGAVRSGLANELYAALVTKQARHCRSCGRAR